MIGLYELQSLVREDIGQVVTGLAVLQVGNVVAGVVGVLVGIGVAAGLAITVGSDLNVEPLAVRKLLASAQVPLAREEGLVAGTFECLSEGMQSRLRFWQYGGFCYLRFTLQVEFSPMRGSS